MRHFFPKLFPFLVLFITTGINAQAQNSSSTLQPGTPVEQTISAGQTHSYTISLSDEQFLQFVVMQRGVDVLVSVFSPAGKRLAAFDTPNGANGPEHCSIVSVSAGVYRIDVAPLESSTRITSPGRYEINTVEVRRATEQELKAGQNDEATKKKALALLNEVIESIPEIRQEQTRVKVKLQAAQILWTVDEKKAAKLLSESLTDAKDYLATIKLDDERYDEVFQWTNQVRYEAVQTLALHDPEAALELFRATRPSTDDSPHVKQMEEQFELSLASQLAAKNPQRAYEMAEASIKTGYPPTLIQTINELSKRDSELATKLAEKLVGKLMSEKLLKTPQAFEMSLNLLRLDQPISRVAAESSAGSSENILLSRNEYKELVQKLLNEALSVTPSQNRERQEGPYALFRLRSLGPQLDTVVPGATAALDKKLKEMGAGGPLNEWAQLQQAINDSSPEDAMDAISQAPEQFKGPLLEQLTNKTINSGDFAKARQIITESSSNPRQRQLALINLERQAALRDASDGKIEEALGHLAKLPSAKERATILVQFASRIGPGYKRETAVSLLEKALNSLGMSVRAENVDQLNARAQVAIGFARYDSKRAFEIVDPLIDQFNELSEAARTMNGFAEDFFVEGELFTQNGNTLSTVSTSLTSALGSLSAFDFDRAKLTSERLKLPEVRIIARLGIAQQAIQPSGPYSANTAYLNILNR